MFSKSDEERVTSLFTSLFSSVRHSMDMWQHTTWMILNRETMTMTVRDDDGQRR